MRIKLKKDSTLRPLLVYLCGKPMYHTNEVDLRQGAQLMAHYDGCSRYTFISVGMTCIFSLIVSRVVPLLGS